MKFFKYRRKFFYKLLDLFESHFVEIPLKATDPSYICG